MWSTLKGNVKKVQERSLIDKFFSKLKIVIGFYQVTAGVLQAFSYIEWPDSLEVIAEYSELLQLNVLQMVPLECLIKGFRVNAFGNMFTMMAVNSLIICVSGVAYGVRKVVIARNESLKEEEKSSKLSETKELVYRNLFFFLYVTYLNTCTTTANVLPLACQTLCRDEKEESFKLPESRLQRAMPRSKLQRGNSLGIHLGRLCHDPPSCNIYCTLEA